jgi:uncharacterized membrane protein
MVIGIGMGGFIDGILFHQILQIHNMLSARVPTDTLLGAKVNMVWDGLFHAAVWTTTALGIAMLWRATNHFHVRKSGRVLAGSLLMGWGLFNLVEGIIDHHILSLHHVYEQAGQSVWDWLFLAFGIALIASGWFIVTSERNKTPMISKRRRTKSKTL